jgi:hypothetical protein
MWQEKITQLSVQLNCAGESSDAGCASMKTAEISDLAGQAI